MDKLTDKLSIFIPEFQQTLTQKRFLSYVASVYDLLVIISSCHVLGKVIYSQLYDEESPCDAEIIKHLKSKLVKLVRDISSLTNEMPGPVALYEEPTTAVDLQVIGDSSKFQVGQ